MSQLAAGTARAEPTRTHHPPPVVSPGSWPTSVIVITPKKSRKARFHNNFTRSKTSFQNKDMAGMD